MRGCDVRLGAYCQLGYYIDEGGGWRLVGRLCVQSSGCNIRRLAQFCGANGGKVQICHVTTFSSASKSLLQVATAERFVHL